MGLKEYKEKRNFSRTREPAGRVHVPSEKPAALFVIQKHAATRLHYDFRLEMEGVLKSWAVPKGFPTKKGDRRLAVQVEDHPLEYANFEGTIPKGHYGGGTVMVWDMGTYQVSGDDPTGALRSGKLHFTLKGKKLKGEWTLVRMRARGNEDKPQWLLLKSGSDVPSLSERAEAESVLTKRSLEQIAAAPNRKEWESNRAAASSSAEASGKTKTPASGNGSNTRGSRSRASSRVHDASARGARVSDRQRSKIVAPGVPEPPGLFTALPEVNLRRLPKAKPVFVEPMKAMLVDTLPQGPRWVYEVKFDGVRALAIKTKKGVALVSRAAKELTAKYSEIAEALRDLPVNEAVLDGELVAVDAEGRSAFQLLQSYQTAATRPPLFYYVFDLINLEGKDLTGLPLLQRKAMAEALVANLSPIIRFSSSIKADSERVMREMKARGLEGLIAKDKGSKYEVGQRSGAWAKFKWTNEQEFVIGGFTQPQGARTHLGAILAGYYQDGKLLFAGKVGTGFNHKTLSALHKTFQKLVRPDCPFANLPERLPNAYGKGLTAGQMKYCTWLEPKLVCQVRFAEWTRDHHLRQPAFLGLREDKRPEEVVREEPR